MDCINFLLLFAHKILTKPLLPSPITTHDSDKITDKIFEHQDQGWASTN